jgi:lambda repressor-like predicted transcriptional regulator
MYRWIALGAVGVIAGALTLGVLTGALSPPGLGLNTAHAQAERGPGPFAEGPRWGIVQAVADLLGMTPREILAERRAGRSLAEIAAARGVDQATLVQTLTSTFKTRLDQAVAAGRLTQERADALLQQAQQRIAEQVTRAEAPGPRPRPRAGEQRGPRRGPRAGE